MNKNIWLIVAIIVLVSLLFFTKDIREAIQWIVFSLVFFSLFYAIQKTHVDVSSNGDKIFCYNSILIKVFFFISLFLSLGATFSFVTGKFMDPTVPGNKMWALILGVVFFIVSILMLLSKNQRLIVKANDTIEYYSPLNKSKNFTWKDIDKISFSRDGYNSLIMFAQGKKIKFQPFWSGSEDFLNLLSQKRPDFFVADRES